MSIPCTYDNDTLTISSLNMQGQGWPREEAFFAALKSAPDLYAELCVGSIKEDKGRLVVLTPYSKKLYERILELEPLPEEKIIPKVKKDSLLKPTNEETLKYGY